MPNIKPPKPGIKKRINRKSKIARPPKALRKYEDPSHYISKRLNKIEREAKNYVKKTLQVTDQEALAILGDDAAWNKMLSMKKKHLDLEMTNKLMTSMTEAIEIKLAKGSLEQARSGMTALAIAREKVFEDKGPKGALNVGGKNVQINLGFGFKPYKASK